MADENDRNDNADEPIEETADDDNGGVVNDSSTEGGVGKEEQDSDEDDEDENNDPFIQVETEEDVEEEESSRSVQQMSRWIRLFYRLLLHVFCVMIYVLPMMMETPESQDGGQSAVLDELHIVSDNNRDVNGEASLRTIFSNDYWGRPMTDPSSHKSYRPLTVLTFRYVQEVPGLSTLTVHRLVNALTHACVAEMVAVLATKLLGTSVSESTTTDNAPPSLSGLPSVELLYIFTKLLFALHPTHVEVTSNAANRAHLLAVLCGCVASDVDVPLPIFIVMLVSGYLCCETFLFQGPAILMTMFVLVYLRRYHGPHQVAQGRGNMLHQIKTTILSHSTLALRMVLTIVSALVYVGCRAYFDTLSIPEGLIRPAENPFFTLTGWTRFYSYLYVLSIHVFKAWDWDFVGFSHEYGYACIRVVEEWTDPRLLFPLALFVTYAGITLYLLIRQRRRSVLSIALLLFLFHVAWMMTLFPISGIVKVGTFVADRIVVASTASISICQAYAATSWVLWMSSGSTLTIRQRQQMRQKITVFAVLGLLMWRRIHRRSLQWMDSLPLLESSLETCPNFAKAHLELSKVYSGLYPKKFNLTQSRWHLEKVEEIDPDFCDVHQQFAHVAVQENKYSEFEERLTKALQCEFGRAASIDLWKRYWTMAQDPANNSPASVEAAKKRYNMYMDQIDNYIKQEDAKGPRKESSSPLVGWKWGGRADEL